MDVLAEYVSIPSNGSSLFQQIPQEDKMEIIYLSQSPQTGQVYFNCRNTARWNTQRKMLSQSPQTGQVYFNRELIVPELEEKQLVSIPSNGSSLFQQDFAKVNSYDIAKGLNPLKRVKFISITRKRRTGKENGSCVSIPSNGSSLFQLSTPVIVTENSMKMSLNPLKRVKFISIQQDFRKVHQRILTVSIPSNGSSLFQSRLLLVFGKPLQVSIPSNGSSLFQQISHP